MPSLGMPVKLLQRNWIFSGRVRREIRDRARKEIGSEELQKGYEFWGGLHGN